MNRFAHLFVALVMGLGVAVGCDKDSTAPAPSGQSAAKTDDHDHDHGHDHGKGDDHEGERHDLGTKPVGGLSVKVAQVGEVEPGKDVIFEVAVTGAAGVDAKPKAVRAWIGIESGEGSAKGKGEAAGEEYDVHVEVPAKLPEGGQLWVEVETAAGRQKVAFGLPAHEHDHDHAPKSGSK